MGREERPHVVADGGGLNFEDLGWPTVYALTTSLVGLLSRAQFRPDYMVAVYDPGSAGGYAVAAQLAALLAPAHTRPIGLLRIEGRSGSRVITQLPSVPVEAERVLIVDDVAWSGNSLLLARDALARMTSAELRSCTLLAGGAAIERGVVDFYARRTEARDVAFPWGTVTPTAEYRRFFRLPERSSPREVSWAPRPWGYWEQFALNEQCTVRILTIFPGEYLSLQYHQQRDEFFVALDDGVTLQVGERTITANRGDYILIPRNVPHRQFAPSSHVVRVLEISFGHYDQVGDIVRLEDKYGRRDLDGSV